MAKMTQQKLSPAKGNWTCQDNPGGPVNLKANDPLANGIVQAHVCAAGNECIAPEMPLHRRHRCAGCGFAVHIPCQVEFDLNGLSLPFSNFSGICRPCVGGLGLVKLITRDDCDHPFLPFTSPRVHHIAKNRWLSVTIQKPRAKQDKNATGKPQTEVNKATPDPATTALQKHTPAPTVPLPDADPKDAISIDDDEQLHDTVKETNTNASSAGDTTTTNKPAAKDKDFSADKVFMDLRIRLEADEDVMGAMDKAIARVKAWYLAMLRVQPDFRLHTVDPDSETLTQLDDPEKFPSKLPDCKDFFAGLRPHTRGGNLQLKVLASSKRGMTKVAKETEFYHHALKENFAVSPIQWHSTKLSNWLLYSTRQTDCKKLGEELTKQIGIEVSCRFIRINDRSPYSREDPQGVHVQTAEKDVEEVQDILSKLYSSRATKFPLGMRMRYVSIIHDISSMQALEKFHLLRNRQDGWCQQHQAKTVDTIAAVDTTVGRTGKTLRDMIMAIPATTGNTGTPLYMAINAPWRGKGFVISYHPDKADEAATILNGLYPRLFAQYGDSINNFFTAKGLKKGKTMTWDPTTNQVSSAFDDEIAGVYEADPEMMSLGDKARAQVAAELPQREFTFQKERGDADSISTMGGTRRSRSDEVIPPSKKPRTDVVTMDADSASNASSLTAGTKYTMQTKMSTLETNVTDMQKGFKQMETMMQTFMQQQMIVADKQQAIAADSARGEPPQPITPGGDTTPTLKAGLPSNRPDLGGKAEGPSGSSAAG
jgi:hypothetical protein